MRLQFSGQFLIHLLVVLSVIFGTLGTVFHLLTNQKPGRGSAEAQRLSISLPPAVQKVTADISKVGRGLVPPPPPEVTSVWLPSLGQ